MAPPAPESAKPRSILKSLHLVSSASLFSAFPDVTRGPLPGDGLLVEYALWWMEFKTGCLEKSAPRGVAFREIVGSIRWKAGKYVLANKGVTCRPATREIAVTPSIWTSGWGNENDAAPKFKALIFIVFCNKTKKVPTVYAISGVSLFKYG